MKLESFDPKKQQYRILIDRGEGTELLDITGLVTSGSWGDEEGNAIGSLDLTLAQKYFESAQGYTDDLVPSGTYLRLMAGNELLGKYRVRYYNTEYSTNNISVNVRAYDRIFNLSHCEESWHYDFDQDTRSLVKNLLDRAETKFEYNYVATRHPEIWTKSETMLEELSDFLDYAYKLAGEHKPIVLMIGDTLHITHRDYNEVTYRFYRTTNMTDTGNIISFSRTNDITNIITRVRMRGHELSENNYEDFGGMDGETGYDILQKELYANGEESEFDIKREAMTILNEDGKPKITYRMDTIDNPFIRKGHRIMVELSEKVSGYFFVLSVSHDIVNKTMSMVIEPENYDKKFIAELSEEDKKREEEYKKKKAEEERQKHGDSGSSGGSSGSSGSGGGGAGSKDPVYERLVANRKKVIDTAKSHLGQNGTEFQNRMGLGKDQAWCAAFVNCIFQDCGFADRIPRTSYVPDYQSWAQHEGIWRAADGNYVPNAGDLVIFDNNHNGSGDHIGIVFSVKNAKSINSVEGNTGSPRQVMLKGHTSNILGYIAVNLN